jgi:anti-sigma factor RsiW
VSSTEVEALSCQELVELVTDYLEGALSPEERERFESHLAECVNCVTYLDQIRATIRLTGTLRSEDLDPQAEETLLAAFRTWKSP